MLEIRPVEEKDIPTVIDLAGKIWREHYPSVIPMEQIEFMLSEWYTLEVLRSHLNNGHLCLLGLWNGEPIGFITMHPLKKPGEYFLMRFYIDRAYKGKGIGTAMFNHALSQLGPVQEVELRVNRRNIHAINAYFKMGFRITGLATLEVGGNGYVMDDFIMRLTLKDQNDVHTRAA